MPGFDGYGFSESKWPDWGFSEWDTSEDMYFSAHYSFGVSFDEPTLCFNNEWVVVEILRRGCGGGCSLRC